METLKPIFVGFLVGIGTYAIIKASKDNPKVIRIIVIIGLIIAIALVIILTFFLMNAFLNN